MAHVYTPDLRGHGIAPAKRGDIDYIKQYEDDLADLIKLTKTKHPNSKLIMGGHSSDFLIIYLLLILICQKNIEMEQKLLPIPIGLIPVMPPKIIKKVLNQCIRKR